MKKLVVTSLALLCAGCAVPLAEPEKPKQSPVAQLIVKKAEEHQIPSQLAYALLKKESNLDPAVQNKNNYGLGQINCTTAKGFGFNGPCFLLLEADTNLTYSMKYLRVALDKSKEDWCRAVTLYQKGLYTRSKKNDCDAVMRLSKLTIQ